MEIVHEQCSRKGCGHSPFPMAKKFQARCRKTHETFHCPGGHPQYYPGMSDEEKLRKQLREQQEHHEMRMGWLRRELHSCPWIGCDFEAQPVNDYDRRAMWSHLRAAHGMPTKGQVLAELHASDNLTTDE